MAALGLFLISLFLLMESSECLAWSYSVSAFRPVNIHHLLVHTGHPGLWLRPQSPRAAPAEAFWEETQSCSRPHPGGCFFKKRTKRKENSAIPRWLHRSFKNKQLKILQTSPPCRALGGFTPPIFPAQTCCARGTFTSRLYPFRCTGEWRLPVFSYAPLSLSSKRRHFPRVLWRNTKRQRARSNLCCCWNTNSTSGYYIKLAAHVGARLCESANKRLSDSADVYFFFLPPM